MRKKLYSFSIDEYIMNAVKTQARVRNLSFSCLVALTLHQTFCPDKPAPKLKKIRCTDRLNARTKNMALSYFNEGWAAAKAGDPGLTRREYMNQMCVKAENEMREMLAPLTTKEGE